ncbi:hypothetical protein [Halorubrum saccharovorum]|uniref:hypothetical protein n=1 Tax=Halorubrum saccharovorum TaxID=2248 RepID=UPI001268FFE4|nr:hypothetical protein [Halorubrum saccharovorum]
MLDQAMLWAETNPSQMSVLLTTGLVVLYFMQYHTQRQQSLLLDRQTNLSELEYQPSLQLKEWTPDENNLQLTLHNAGRGRAHRVQLIFDGWVGAVSDLNSDEWDFRSVRYLPKEGRNQQYEQPEILQAGETETFEIRVGLDRRIDDDPAEREVISLTQITNNIIEQEGGEPLFTLQLRLRAWNAQGAVAFDSTFWRGQTRLDSPQDFETIVQNAENISVGLSADDRQHLPTLDE